MNCFEHFLDQVLRTIVATLPSLIDWLVTRLQG